MKKRTIYINPGDFIDIRIINDPELPKNAKEWSYQTQPQNILIQVHNYQRVEFADPMIYCESMGVKKRLYLET